MHGHAGSAFGRRGRGELSGVARQRTAGQDHRIQRRRGRLYVGRRRHDERGRMVGSAEHRLQSQAAGDLRRRGQRLRDLAFRSRSARRAAIFRSSSSGFPIFIFRNVDGTDPLASYAAFKRRGRVLPRTQRPGVRPRQGHSPVFALAFGRRKALSPRRGTRGRRRDRPDQDVRRISDDRGHRFDRGARSLAKRGRRRGQQGRGHRDRNAAARAATRRIETFFRRTSTRPTGSFSTPKTARSFPATPARWSI